MGITGELVRSVFSKNRSVKTHDYNLKNSSVEKKKWKASVKSYLCGDEFFDSVVAEEDSASVKSSEATVMQLLPEDCYVPDDIQSQCTANREDQESDPNSLRSRSLDEDAAATIIQSAYRGFKVRCLMRRYSTGFQNCIQKGIESPSKESLATSIEVQTGNSTGIVSMQEEEEPSVSTKHQHKPKPSTFKPKEDWDDSILDSNASKMRIQNRLEAMTRRERAMAYAFSQQLRICSKKNQAKTDGSEPGMGWRWLERWMATRQMEVPPMEDCTSKQLNNYEAGTTVKIQPFLRKKFLDLSFEEKESCGSNEVPVKVAVSPISERKNKDGTNSAKNRLKAPRIISRRKTVPAYQNDHIKMGRKEGTREAAKEKRQRAKQARHSNVCKDDATWLAPDHSEPGQNSKTDP